ncbi:MAG: hypothetical protein AAF337_09665 [Pseudomonadota bacterium]
MATQVSIVYYSGFQGATEQLAKAVARGAGTIDGTTAHLIHTNDVDDHWDTLHASDAIMAKYAKLVSSSSAGAVTDLQL